MLTGIALIFLSGMFMGWLFKRLGLPALLGMLLTGMLLGPNGLDIIDRTIIDISPALRQTALVIILTRAGLSLDIRELKKAGRPALLMCFVPASMEIIGTVIFAPMLFGVSYVEAALIGTVLAAVSPAVVVPAMLKVINDGYGVRKQIPQIILAGASADDVYVIVLFTTLSALAAGGNARVADLVQIPTSVILGASVGISAGLLLFLFFRKIHIRDSSKLIIIVSLSFLALALQDITEKHVRISGLIAVVSLAMTIYVKNPDLAKRLSERYGKLWVAAEIMLFVLVGAAVNISSLTQYGIRAVLLLAAAMLFRMMGVLLSLAGTSLEMREKLFCMLAYMPKATVQAAIGAVPLAMGLDCGTIVLSAAVLSIIITAPLGSFLIEISYKKLLKKQQ